jgi:serine/threonine protein kinase
MAKIIDNYILIESIGQGDFGEIHKGRNLISKEAVAVKTIKLDRFLNDTLLRDMIINEIQALKKLED